MTNTTDPTATFPLLADPAGYRACLWELADDAPKLSYWLGLFRKHFPTLLEEAVKETADAAPDDTTARARADEAQTRFFAHLDALAENPTQFGPLNILEICYERERILRACEFADPYRLAKHKENESAIAVLPQVLSELDAMEEAERRHAAIEGVFAGNIFDLGATQTADMFREARVDFHDTREKLRPRPWFDDCLEAWCERLAGPAHRAAVLFVDNAGPDVVLGMIPFARELLRRGTRVILTANTYPSLNDVTYDELVALLEEIAPLDALLGDAFSAERLTVVPSGNWAPLIDLTKVSAELVEAVEREQVDLLVLEGMGRAVESNYHVPFTCDTLKLAMIKDRGVADALGAEVFDLVMRFEPNG